MGAELLTLAPEARQLTVQWTAAEHTQTVVSHAREVSDPMRVLEQGPDRQRAPGCCLGGLSSMLWSLPVVDVVTMPPGKNFRLWGPPSQGKGPLQWHLDKVEATISGWS